MSSPAPFRPSRRRFLFGSLAFLAIGSASAGWMTTRSKGRAAWVEATIRKHLPGVQLDPVSLEQFARAYAAKPVFSQTRQRALVFVDQTLPGLARHVQKSARKIEWLERSVVSDYLVGSNFFRVPDPKQTLIVHAQEINVCGNPFAVFLDS